MRNITPQRLAWITILGGLSVFLLLCASAVIFARWMLFESPTQLNVTLLVGRGTVGVAKPDSSGEQAVRGSAGLAANSTLTTDNDSQGYMEFTDPYSGDVIATVMLRGNSGARLRNASRPRFSFSDNPYVIRVDEINGRLDVWVNDNLDRNIQVMIENDLGDARIEQSGTFSILSTPVSLTVTALNGTATLVGNARQAQLIASGMEGAIRQDSTIISVDAGAIDLMLNPYFDQGEDWPSGWTCGHTPDPDFLNAPEGQWDYPTIDGRHTIHIERMAPNPGPARTGCFQYLKTKDEGLDVSGYTDLRLRVTMRVHHQSLSACGMAGSECPVMLHMWYADPSGNLFEWYHGFYAELRPNEEARTICDSCLEDHEPINKDAWYTYESGNLFTFLPQDRRPGSIIQIEFYASGHQYDVMLDQVSLFARATHDTTAPQAAAR